MFIEDAITSRGSLSGSIDARRLPECNPARPEAFTWASADDEIRTELEGDRVAAWRGFARSSYSEAQTRASQDNG